MPGVKHVNLTSLHSGTTFNNETRLLWGANGRLRGLEVSTVAGGTRIKVNPGVFLTRGIVCEMTSVTQADAPTANVSNEIPVTGAGVPPYGLVADTADGSDLTPFVFSVVGAFDPNLPRADAIIAYTDTSGQNWTLNAPLGIKEIRDLRVVQQFSELEVQILTSKDGNINNASPLHGHQGIIGDQACFEDITGLSFVTFPNVSPHGRGPVDADKYHKHKNLLTNEELDVLTSRNGLQSADTQHTHGGLLTEAQRIKLTGGPTTDASDLHDHFKLRQAHGIFPNPTATPIYVKQNVGDGNARVRGLFSSFQGSIKLLLGPRVSGDPVNSVTGIRYKENARFWQDTTTSSFGDCAPGVTTGTPIAEFEELFVPGAVSGVVQPVAFNTVFRWRGLDIVVETPAGGVAFDTADYFIYNGIVRNTGPSGSENGAPSNFANAHERELSIAGLRLVGVLDPKFKDGGYWTIPYM